MNVFRTPVEVLKSSYQIKPDHQLCFLGSCFADHIGKLLQQYAFDAQVNPRGMLYNPVSVSNTIQSVLRASAFTEDDVVFWNGQYVSFDFSTDFFAETAADLLLQLNQSNARLRQSLLNARAIWITLGTSWVYQHKEKGRIVANCHKMPANRFNHYRLSQREIVEALDAAFSLLHEMNPNAKLIVTVSPVRHWKNGAHENQLSKSLLLLALDDLCQHLDYLAYFPAYEIMLDELRDYRFYDVDMQHPSSLAVQYIFDRFRASFFDADAEAFCQQAEKIRKSLDHRPLRVGSEQHFHLLHRINQEILGFQNHWGVDAFESERLHIVSRTRSV